MRARAWMAALLAGCGSAPAPPAPTPEPVPSSPAAPAGHALVGHWRTDDGSAAETWIQLGDTLAGAGFFAADGRTQLYEALVLHRDGERTLYTAMPAGKTQVDFAAEAELQFANEAHDDPRTIRYVRDGDGLTAHLDGDGGPRSIAFRRAPPAAAPELEAADTAFAADSAARGGAAWADRFEAEGAHWPVGGARTQGPDAIAARIDALRARGLHMRWAPSGSGLSPAGDVGFTAGRYRLVRDGGGEAGAGVYVTIWRRAADGTWKIAFDTGL